MSHIDTVERDKFLRTIRENPDDDTARLVYADWLQERGEEDRAEFIRVQCATENTEFVCDSRDIDVCNCEYCVLKRRERSLNINTVFWGSELPFPCHPENSSCNWVKGFIKSIRIEYTRWQDHTQHIINHPDVVLRTVNLTTWPDFEYQLDGPYIASDGDFSTVRGSVTINSNVDGNRYTRADISEPDMSTFFTVREQREREFTLLLLSVIWPGVAFTLPEGPRPNRNQERLRQLQEMQQEETISTQVIIDELVNEMDGETYQQLLDRYRQRYSRPPENPDTTD